MDRALSGRLRPVYGAPGDFDPFKKKYSETKKSVQAPYLPIKYMVIIRAMAAP
jgi:hypothetical protein